MHLLFVVYLQYSYSSIYFEGHQSAEIDYIQVYILKANNLQKLITPKQAYENPRWLFNDTISVIMRQLVLP